MDAWVTLKNAIPKGEVRSIAARMRLSYDYVCRWRREPLGDESPLSTGQASPLGRTCDLIDAVFLVNPPGASYIVEHIKLHYQLLLNAHGIQGFNGSDRARTEAASDLLRQATAAICALNSDSLSDHTVRELVLLRDATDLAISRVSKDLNALK